MTINNFDTAKAIVDEAGPDRIDSVYQYRHALTGMTLYAVFMKGAYVDIYESPFCTDQDPLFLDGQWL